MRQKIEMPWLTASEVERPIAELKEISKSWDAQTWNAYLNWFEAGNSEKLITKNVFDKISEEIEKNIFEEFGYQSCPKLQRYCEQLLAALPAHQAQILRLYFYEGRTHKEIAFLFNRSDRTISHNKNTALKTLKRVHGGKTLAARQYMRGAVVLNSDEVQSEWNEKLSKPVCSQRTYSQSAANEVLLNHECIELREIFQDLSERSRQIMYLKFWCDLRTSEIARKCSVGLNTVEQILEATVFKIKSQIIQKMKTTSHYAV